MFFAVWIGLVIADWIPLKMLDTVDLIPPKTDVIVLRIPFTVVLTADFAALIGVVTAVLIPFHTDDVTDLFRSTLLLQLF